MKHTFKILAALLLVFCLILSLAACSAENAAPTAAAKPSDPVGSNNAEMPPVEPEVLPAGTGAPEGERDDGRIDAVPGADFGSYISDDSSFSYEKGSESAPAAPVAPGYAAGDLPSGSVSFEPVEGRIDVGEPVVIDDPAPAPDEPVVIEPAPVPDEPVTDPGRGLVLTAAEWNDNEHWPFFTNLVNAGTISFPSFGLDPRNRIQVRVTDEGATDDALPRANETVTLLDAAGTVLWTARTDKNGTAYVFFAEGQSPDRVVCGEAEAPVLVPETGGDPQGSAVMRPLDSVVLTLPAPAPSQQELLQVMFIVDTTGSMGDELAYLQKDFSAIAERVGAEGVRYSVSFYRDEGDDYVTRHNPFTADVAELQKKINEEYAAGGGDEPEAVAQVLTECLTNRTDWDENAVKLAFLIFDAPPHSGTDAALQAAARAAAEKGIRLIPVVASNAARETELFGRALAILTNGSYVFLTDDSGVGGSHLEPIVGDYDVELLQDLIVKIIERYR